jgi:diguanylate cyclase (GGDEF)-like protein
MPETDEKTAIEIAELIKETVGNLGLKYFDADESVSKTLSVSIGVATQKMALSRFSRSTDRIADENLYRAKRHGKNFVWSATDNLPNS